MGDEACMEGFDDSDELPIEPWPEAVDGWTLLPGNAQLRGILNAGYTQDMAYVLRIVSERGGSRLARFSCWGPKAIAQIGHLPEGLEQEITELTEEANSQWSCCSLSSFRVASFYG